MTWKKISSKTLLTHPRITVVEDIVELPGGEQVPYLKFDESKHSASVICIRGDEVLLQKEYSYPPNEVLYQFPGGAVEASESPAVGAGRELTEEAGLKPKTLQELGWFYANNRRTDRKAYVYLCADFEVVEQIGGDTEEDITSHWTPIGRVDEMIRSGEIVNYSLLAAWAMFKAK